LRDLDASGPFLFHHLHVELLERDILLEFLLGELDVELLVLEVGEPLQRDPDQPGCATGEYGSQKRPDNFKHLPPPTRVVVHPGIARTGSPRETRAAAPPARPWCHASRPARSVAPWTGR